MARLVATCYPYINVIAILYPFLLLKKLDDEVHLLLDIVYPLVQSFRLLAEFTRDGGLSRLEGSSFNGCNCCQVFDTYHGGPRELLDQLGERFLTDDQSLFGILSGYLWIPRIRGITRRDGDIDPVPQPSVAIQVNHGLEQADAYHRDKEKEAHDIAVDLWRVVGSTNTVTALDLTLMYASRVRHSLNKSGQTGREYTNIVAYSKGAMNSSTRLNGAGYTNSSGALINPIVLVAKNVKNSASASSTIWWKRSSSTSREITGGGVWTYVRIGRCEQRDKDIEQDHCGDDVPAASN